MEADAAEFRSPLPKQAAEHVQRAYFPEVIRLLDRYYGRVDYSLTSLLPTSSGASCAYPQLDAVGH